MENSVRDPDCPEFSKKSRSLDLKSLYVEKSNVSIEESEGRALNRKRRSLLENKEFGSEIGKKRRKSRKEVSLSSLEPDSKKSGKFSNASDGTKTHRLGLDHRDSEKKKNGRVSGDGNLKSSSTDVSSNLDGNVISIPKRPRDFSRRKKTQSTDVSNQSEISRKVSSHAEIVKLTGYSVTPTASSEGKWKNVFDEFKENSSNKANSGQSFKAKDGFTGGHGCDPILKRRRRDHGKRQDSGTQEETCREEIGPMANTLSEKFEEFQYNDEENLEENAARMLSSRFDPSCTVFPGSTAASVSKSMNGFLSAPSCRGDSESHLVNHSAGSESNSADAAGRVLRPRKKGKEKRHVRKRRHFYEIFSDNVDAYWVLNRRIKVYWPLDQCWYFGLITGYDPQGKLHHVKYDDREEEWIDLHNERFKLLLLPSEVPCKPDLEKSGSKYQNEEKGDMEEEDDNCVGSYMDSEPIISWLTRSSHRVKSSPVGFLKKQKTPSLSKNLSPPLSSEGSVGKLGSCLVDDASRPIRNKRYGTAILQERSIGGEMAEKSVMEIATCSEDRKLHSVYFRKRLRRKGQVLGFASRNFAGSVQSRASVIDWIGALREYDIACQSSSVKDLIHLDHDSILWCIENVGSLRLTVPLVESKFQKLRLNSGVPFHSVDLTFVAETFAVFHTLFLLHNGGVVTLWPMVQLEMLFVDNVVGLRFMVFEGCLMRAVAFVCLVLVAFHQPGGDREFVDQQLPVTSIRFELTGFQNRGRRLVFVFYNFLDVKSSKWLYLDGKLKQYCSFSKQLALSECTYDNIKFLQSKQSQLSVPSAYGEPVSLEALRKRSRHGIMHMGVTKESAINIGISTSNFDEQHKRLPQLVLSFAAAPTFFLSLHLKLLMARNVSSISFHNPMSLVESPEDSGRLTADDCSLAEDCYDQATLAKDAGCSSKQVIIGSGLSSFAEPKVELQTLSKIGLNGEFDVTGTSIGRQDSGKSENSGTVEQQRHPCHDSVSEQCIEMSHSSFPPDHSSQDKSETECLRQSHGISVQIPQLSNVESQLFDGETTSARHSSDLAWNVNDCNIRSPNPTAPRSIWHRSKHSAASFSFGHRSKMWADGQADMNHNGLLNGSRKPRSQVSYLLPLGGYDFSSKPRSHRCKGRPYKRIRNNAAKLMVEGSRSPQRHTDLLSCDANILITSGDRGWRECGAQVVLECIDHNDWRLVVKLLGTIKYSYKAYQFLQPGTTNRYTHAMMWKGGKDWILEFPDRSQWTIFKEMHEECYNRNIRAASVKTIPIPGVCLIEESDDSAMEVPFVRSSPKYIRQVGTEVDMALNPSCVLYDMDSDDEEWILKRRTSSVAGIEISEDMFERIIDMFEKVSYAQQRDDFTGAEMEELMVGVGSIDVVKEIYDYWKQKRQEKRMPLIRQFQPPLWERYQLQLKEWEMAVNTIQNLPNGCKEKASVVEKPPMFAFCLRPRGLEVPNKGSKQRSHRKLTAGAHNYSFSRDQEGLQLCGRKSNGVSHGEERVHSGHSHESLHSSPWMTSTRAVSPRDAIGAGYLSMSSDGSERSQYPKLRRDKSKKMGMFTSPIDSQILATSYNQRTGKRNGVCRWNIGQTEWPGQKQYLPEQRHRIEQLGGSDLDEFRLRDASSAAQHASNMAKLKREKAQRLFYRADVAMHKAMVALMTAEAIKASSEDPNYDG